MDFLETKECNDDDKEQVPPTDFQLLTEDSLGGIPPPRNKRGRAVRRKKKYSSSTDNMEQYYDNFELMPYTRPNLVRKKKKRQPPKQLVAQDSDNDEFSNASSFPDQITERSKPKDYSVPTKQAEEEDTVSSVYSRVFCRRRVKRKSKSHFLVFFFFFCRFLQGIR